MDQMAAFRDTLRLAQKLGHPKHTTIKGTSLIELQNLYSRCDISASDAKRGRWLGWTQACVVMHTSATLEDMKQINRSHA